MNRLLLGVGLVAAGGAIAFGGITGRLAPMLAALFDPKLLTTPQATGKQIGPFNVTVIHDITTPFHLQTFGRIGGKALKGLIP